MTRSRADVESWPRCDVLISFFSTDFPLDKAISYVKLRSPLCINALPPQALLWDRRLVGAVLDHLRNILTNPSFVPIEEVMMREEEIKTSMDETWALQEKVKAAKGDPEHEKLHREV